MEASGGTICFSKIKYQPIAKLQTVVRNPKMNILHTSNDVIKFMLHNRPRTLKVLTKLYCYSLSL